MNTSGLSMPGLERMNRVLAQHVERGDIPGMIALAARDDALHVEILGRLSLEGSALMPRDAIFRIASVTKPIVAVAAMILIEECRLRLDDSIEPWLPELASRRVLKSIDSPLDETVPARRAITVRDLLTYRMGFGSVMAMPGTYPIQQYIRDLKIGGDGPPHPAQTLSPDEWMKNLGSLPLLAQPGEQWMYNVSGDVLGVLIARVCGQSLGAFLREKIFDPLGMSDTGFHVPAASASRLAGCYQFDHEQGRFHPYDDRARSEWSTPPAFESGAGGLVSTLDDCFAFSRMMLNNGQLGSARILSRASVELMTSDQLEPQQREGANMFFEGHSSWGFGMGVDIGRREIYHSPGRYGWTGGLGTALYNDPANRAITILLTQRLMDSPEPPQVFSDFFTLAHAAFA